MRGWEIVGNPEHQEEEDDLTRFDHDREIGFPEDTGPDDDEWRNWHVDYLQPHSYDEWDENVAH